jgi:cbb3-type cytochrome oxidase subunit 3
MQIRHIQLVAATLGLIAGTVCLLLVVFVRTPPAGRIPFMNRQLAPKWNQRLMFAMGLIFIAVAVFLFQFNQGQSH